MQISLILRIILLVTKPSFRAEAKKQAKKITATQAVARAFYTSKHPNPADKHSRMKAKKHERLAYRLVDIISRLNQGERLDIHELAADYQTTVRTIQRDLNERLALLEYSESGSRYYSLNKSRQGHMNDEEIRRIARFASIQELFPDVDRRFYQEKLHQSILIKGFQYENISDKQREFDLLTRAIADKRYIEFTYRKTGGTESKSYRLQPYHLVNKNGIWYLIGIDGHQQKTYCFTQIENLALQVDNFADNPALREQIRATDSIYHGNQLSEIVVSVDSKVAAYFKRRALLPNQETVRELEDGALLLASKNIHPNEIVPIVRYWLPHLHIVSPAGLQQQMEGEMREYLEH